MNLKRTALVALLAWMSQLSLQAQTIKFNVHVASSLNATRDQNMAFGEVTAGDGQVDIEMGSSGMGVFAITGNEELDVIVTLTKQNLVNTSPSSSSVIPLTLYFAYANQGENDINQAVEVTGGTARFQMRQRDSGPAGAPPTPPNASHTPTEVTAYIYLYGFINVGSVDAGIYEGQVDLSVTYD